MKSWQRKKEEQILQLVLLYVGGESGTPEHRSLRSLIPLAGQAGPCRRYAAVWFANRFRTKKEQIGICLSTRGNGKIEHRSLRSLLPLAGQAGPYRRYAAVCFANRFRTKKEQIGIYLSALFWCGKRDLNPYGVNHTPLKRARLPVPPLQRMRIVLRNRHIIHLFFQNVKPFFKKSLKKVYFFCKTLFWSHFLNVQSMIRTRHKKLVQKTLKKSKNPIDKKNRVWYNITRSDAEHLNFICGYGGIGRRARFRF